MSRSGMATLITRLRRMVDDTSSLAWTDDQVQTVLDENRRDIWREALSYVITYDTGGTARYYDYYSRHRNLEETTGGTAILFLQDDDGAYVGTANYTVDAIRGAFTFTADQAGSTRYMTAREYNLNAAAAVLWRERAASVHSHFDVSSGNGESMSRSQKMKHCLEMADYYESGAGAEITIVEAGRPDLMGAPDFLPTHPHRG